MTLTSNIIFAAIIIALTTGTILMSVKYHKTKESTKLMAAIGLGFMDIAAILVFIMVYVGTQPDPNSTS